MIVKNPVKIEVRRENDQSSPFWLAVIFANGKVYSWGTHTTERGVRRMLSIHSNRFGLTKINADLAVNLHEQR